MEAYVSGSANRAAIINGNTALLFVTGKNEPVEVNSNDALNFFLRLEDSVHLSNKPKAEVLRKLNIESSKSNALAMLSFILDNNYDINEKLILVNRLNELLLNDEVYDFVCKIMFARPLPSESINGIPSVIEKGHIRLYTLVEMLLSSQDLVSSVCLEVNSFLRSKEVYLNDRNLIEGILVNNSFFYSVVTNQFDLKKFQTIKFDVVNKLKHSNITDVIHFGSELCKIIQSKINSNTQKTKRNKFNPIEEDDYSDNFETIYKPNRRTENRTDVYLRVKKQIKSITEMLNSSKILQAKRSIEELKASQLEREDNEYAALSLCTISEHAKKLSMFDLQLEYALEASRLAPQDYRTYGHVADAYLNNENVLLAEKYFNKSLQGDIKNQIYSLTGLARIEKQKYNFELALQKINKAAEMEYNDIVPILTKAEILRELHHYEEAEKVYSSLKNQFPENSRAVFGHASLQAEQRKFPKAIEIYKFGLSNYQDKESQSVGKSALGFLYARLGKRGDAKKLLTEACKLNKYESITPHMCLAKAYRFEGNVSRAQSELLQLLKNRPHFSEIADELIDLYLSTGEVKKARVLFDSLKPKLKESKSLQLRNAQIFKQAGDYESAIVIVDKIKQERPKYLSCLLERASIFKMLGNYREARKQYEGVLKINRYNRTAKFNIHALNKLENKNVSISNLDVELTETVDDFESIAQVGLLELSIGKPKEGKEKLLKAYNSGFGVFKNALSSNLSMASIRLGQVNAAIKPVKKPVNSIEHIQKAIVLLEQKKMDLFNKQLLIVDKVAPPFARNLVKMMKNISKAANDDLFSTDEIIDEQIKVMLIAA
jgi:tetratricopeptide (TPR) repeat protein